MPGSRSNSKISNNISHHQHHHRSSTSVSHRNGNRKSSLDSDLSENNSNTGSVSPPAHAHASSAFPDSLPNSPEEPPSATFRQRRESSVAGSLSPTSVAVPSLRRGYFPDDEEADLEGDPRRTSADRTHSAAQSLRRPSVPDRQQPVSQPNCRQSVSLQIDSSRTNNMSDSRRSSRRASEVPPEQQFSLGDDDEAGEDAPIAEGGLRLPMPSRPALHTINSSTGLLSGDASSPNTPFTPYADDPFNRSSGILDNGSLAPDSEPSSPINGASHPDDSSAPPKIHLNSSSIPNTPEHPSATSFDARPSFSAPFASAHDVPSPTQLTNRRRGSSVAPSQQAPSNYGATDDEDATKKNNHVTSTNASSARLTTISGGLTSGTGSKSNIINRRSQRAKANRVSKKDRESRDYKGTGGGLKRAPFQSTRLKGEIYKPWMEKRDPAMRWARWITIASIIIGVALAAFLCYNGYAAVPNLGKVCERLNDDFNTLDTNTWQREVRLDGYGHGSFQWTTDDDKNSFVEDGILYLVPTLTSDVIGEESVSNGYTLNLTTDGTCTSTNVSQCVAVSNSSRLTVINPVRSARLITKNTVTLNYGKVEVKAKFPTGDWLWPSISLLPVNNTYGEWPRSGQIDILTGRGNNNSYPNRGVDYAQSSLHWGPTVDLDRLWMTWGYREQRREYYNQKWHTYGLEWNDKYMWTYIDSKVSQVISLRFNKQSFWERGKFPSTITNTTTGDVIKLINPWLSSEKNNAPFDQPFYLVLDLSVGATDGWFPDGEGGKPWLDNSGTAMSDFWNSKDRWWNQWSTDPKERGFAIDSVKMWEVC